MAVSSLMSGRIREIAPTSQALSAASPPSSVDVRYEVSLELASGDVKRLPLEPDTGLTLRRVSPPLCRECGAFLRQSAIQNVCYDCAQQFARYDRCITSPDRCHFGQGTCREPDWAAQFCMQPHVVYLSVTSGPKVGITRQGRELRRWADQGAHHALVIAQLPSRHASGLVEHAARRLVSDRTDWRRLVRGVSMDVDLFDLAGQLKRELGSLDKLITGASGLAASADVDWHTHLTLTALNYPVRAFSPAQMLKLTEAQPEFSGNLRGVIGSYLLFSQGVIARSELLGGNIDAEIGPRLNDVEGSPPQLSLFDV